jgi:AcrR family transcriptional regulator
MGVPGTSKSCPSTVALRCERLRDDILEKAITLFARDGYADADLQELADIVGVGKGTLYRHFGSKEKLFLAAADRLMHNLRQHVDASTRGVDDPLEQIRRAIRAYLEFFSDNPHAVEMLIQERAHFKDRRRLTYFEHREAGAERWRDLYRGLIAGGRVRPMPIDDIRDVISDLCYGTMFVTYITGRKKSPAQTAADLTDVFFHGILTDAERQTRGKKR